MTNFFSPFVFLFATVGVGTLVVLSLSSWFLVVNKMKIDVRKVGIAYVDTNKKRYLWKTRIKEVDYFLGYMPIVPCFMEFKGYKQEEYDALPENEKQYAFLHKSKLQQQFLNFLRILPNILLAIIYSSFANVSLEMILEGIGLVLKMIFWLASVEDFKAYIHRIPQNTALIPFIWAILYGAGSILQIITQLPLHEKIMSTFTLIMGIVMVYLLVYFIPNFLISFFSYSQILKFMFSGLLGGYLICILIFFVLIGIVKLMQFKIKQ